MIALSSPFLKAIQAHTLNEHRGREDSRVEASSLHEGRGKQPGKVANIPRTVKRRRTVADNSGGKSLASLSGYELKQRIMKALKIIIAIVAVIALMGYAGTMDYREAVKSEMGYDTYMEIANKVGNNDKAVIDYYLANKEHYARIKGAY